MVIAENMKPTLKVSMSDSESSSTEDSEVSEDEVEVNEQVADDGEADIESASSDHDSDENDGSALMTNEGWADAVAKVLGSTKPKNKKTLVLSRAKKYTEVVKKETEEKPQFEVIGEGKEEKPDVKKEEPASDEPVVKKKKLDRPSIRLKPNILEKDRERLLNKIATKGVVQLFNAVRNQQKTLDKQLDSEDLTETKKEKILKKFDKRTFLDSLMGNTKSVIVDEAKTVKNELKKEEDKPKWSALRDDFMTGAKMKDWDKESVEE
uniref:RRP15-like protein n=1 Tax=Pectinophora gossypiella TaxID=13191 RepID=A0A1E1WIB7_PECGO